MGWLGGGGGVGLAENIATQPGLAGAWAELGNVHCNFLRNALRILCIQMNNLGSIWLIKGLF